MFEFDGWLDWEPDPDRPARDAALAHDPYVALNKPQRLEKMANARGGREWEFLQELFLNQCTAEEISVGIDEFIKNQYAVFSFEELCFLEGAIDLALQRRNRLRVNGSVPNVGTTEPPGTVEETAPATRAIILDRSLLA